MRRTALGPRMDKTVRNSKQVSECENTRKKAITTILKIMSMPGHKMARRFSVLLSLLGPSRQFSPYMPLHIFHRLEPLTGLSSIFFVPLTKHGQVRKQSARVNPVGHFHPTNFQRFNSDYLLYEPYTQKILNSYKSRFET